MRKLLFGLSIVSALFFTSCEDETSDVIINVTNNNNGGVIEQPTTVTQIGGVQTGDLVLDGPGENVTYEITSALVMEEGTTLTITAGTTIKSCIQTEGYIAIKQGAKIMAQGTASNPIVMTSCSTSPAAGDWGGIVILGKAPINAGSSATSEVGNYPYGGTDEADNSGVIRYMRLEYTGASINDESQYNGFSFYAVGNQTEVSHIEVFEGADDGVEFFGGTLNADHMIIVNAYDDSVDWTEGWTGTLNEVYVIQTSTDVGNAIEADSNEDDNTAQPFSNPTINNMTMIGTGSANGKEAVRLRRGTKVTFNNVYLQGYEEGFDIDNAQTAAHIVNDESNVFGVTFVDVPEKLVTDDDTAMVTEEIFFNQVGSAVATDVATWGAGWSTVGGATTGTPIELAGTYSSNLTLNSANEYTLSGALVMEAGTTLTIPAGVTVRCDAGGVNVYLAILRGAKINAQGTPNNPIVFTSNNTNPAPGDWGGLLLMGNATINSGSSATSEVGNFPYGGNDDGDDSGTIRYMRLEYTGASINDDSQFNGFSFYAVGNGTTVEYVQAHEGADDGFEFFGGTLNVDNMVITNANDDSLDWTEGWRGTLNNVYIVQGETHDKAIEADGNEDDNSATPYSSPTINNITAVGFNDGGEAFRFRRGTQVNLTNVYLKDFGEGIDVDNALTADWILQDVSNAVDVTFDNVATAFTTDAGTDGTSPTESDFISGLGNGTMLDVAPWASQAWTTGL